MTVQGIRPVNRRGVVVRFRDGQVVGIGLSPGVYEVVGQVCTVGDSGSVAISGGEGVDFLYFVGFAGWVRCVRQVFGISAAGLANTTT